MSASPPSSRFAATRHHLGLAQNVAAKRVIAIVTTGGLAIGVMAVATIGRPEQSSARVHDEPSAPARVANVHTSAQTAAGRDRWYTEGSPAIVGTEASPASFGRTGVAVHVADRWYLEAPVRTTPASETPVDKDRWYRE